MKNVCKHKKSFDFVKIIIKNVKSIMMLIYSQLYLIYNELKLKFRRDLTKSTKKIIMNEFFQQFDDKKNIMKHRKSISFLFSTRKRTSFSIHLSFSIINVVNIIRFV